MHVYNPHQIIHGTPELKSSLKKVPAPGSTSNSHPLEQTVVHVVHSTWAPDLLHSNWLKRQARSKPCHGALCAWRANFPSCLSEWCVNLPTTAQHQTASSRLGPRSTSIHEIENKKSLGFKQGALFTTCRGLPPRYPPDGLHIKRQWSVLITTSYLWFIDCSDSSAWRSNGGGYNMALP